MKKTIVVIGFVGLMVVIGLLAVLLTSSGNSNGEGVTIMSATLPNGRSGTSSVWDGSDAYVFGGGNAGGASNQILKYNITQDNLTIIPETLPSPLGGTSAVIDRSSVYIFGGNDGGSYTDEILQYNITNKTVMKMGENLPTSRAGTSAIWNGTHAYIFGGVNGWTEYNEIMRYDPINDNFTVMSAKLPTGRHGTSAIWDGQYAYIFGGWNWTSPPSVGILIDEIVRYDPSTDSIMVMAQHLPDGRYGTSAVWDGQNAYIFGGRNDSFIGPNYDEILCYNISGNNINISSFGLPTPRYYTSSIFNGVHYYIFGGDDGIIYDDHNWLNQIVRYNIQEPFSPLVPFNVTAIPDTWTNINSFTVNWTDPYDESGIKPGAWYKIGSLPVNNSDGTWQGNKPMTVTSIEGAQTIYVWLEDNVGNRNYTNYNTTILYLDTTPPDAFSPNADPDDWTTDNTPQITFSTTDAESGMSHYEIQVASGGFSTQTSPYTLPPQTDGTHTITVRAYDNAGNYWEGTVDIFIDTTPPEAPTDVIATPDTWTNINSFEIDWTDPIESDTSGIATGAWYKIGSPPTSNSDGAWLAAKPITVSSLEGEQTIYIWLEDNVGNVDYLNYGTTTLYLDKTPPLAPIDLTSTPSTWTNINSFSIQWTNPSDLSGVKTGAWYKIGSAPRSNSDGSWLSNKPFTIASFESEQTIYVWLEDNLGNVDYNNYAATTLYLDTTPPAPPTGVSSSPGGWTIANSFSIDWINPADDSGIKSGVWYKIGSPPSSDADGTWIADKPISITSLEGEHTVYIWLEDNVGNRNYLNNSTVDIFLDSTAPNIVHTAVTKADIGKEITVSATVTDNVVVKNVKLYYRKNADETFEIIDMVRDGDIYSGTIPSSLVTSRGIEYYISASDEINTATHPSSNAITEPLPIEIEDDSEPWISSWWWLFLLLAIVLVVIFMLLALRRSEEGGEVGAIEPEETQVEPTEDLGDTQGEPGLTEGTEDNGLSTTKETDQVPPTPSQEMADDEIFQNIKKMHEEGKISDETFEDFKRRYVKE